MPFIQYHKKTGNQFFFTCLTLLIASCTFSAMAAESVFWESPSQQISREFKEQAEPSGKTPHQRLIRKNPGRKSAKSSYAIELSHNDEIFIINNETFEAKTYCFDMEVGDEIVFIEGSPYGACLSAVLMNLRNKRECKVWCE